MCIDEAIEKLKGLLSFFEKYRENGFENALISFPNTYVAYRIMLTIPVSVASVEMSFSKLKIIKTYLRSTMFQQRWNGLALITTI